MIIDCISDLHGSYPEMPGGDLLIIAGDLTARDDFIGYAAFRDWYSRQKYHKIIIIAGNHDGLIEKKIIQYTDSSTWEKLSYLEDSGTKFAGLKIWGSPWTPMFCDWHFMLDRGEEIKKKWDMIPEDTDILITHGPPYGILDDVEGGRVGCEELRKAVERVKPKLHVFGHVHEGYGKIILKHEGPNTICVNCCRMDKNYNPTNKPIRIEL